jgi:hypothetical protein
MAGKFSGVRTRIQTEIPAMKFQESDVYKDLTIGSRTNLLFFFVHQEHLIVLHLPINYRAETDQILATHLQNSPPNARYLSPTIKNELIDICVVTWF